MLTKILTNFIRAFAEFKFVKHAAKLFRLSVQTEARVVSNINSDELKELGVMIRFRIVFHYLRWITAVRSQELTFAIHCPVLGLKCSMKSHH